MYRDVRMPAALRYPASGVCLPGGAHATLAHPRASRAQGAHDCMDAGGRATQEHDYREVGGTTPRMEEVKSCREQGLRVTPGRLHGCRR